MAPERPRRRGTVRFRITATATVVVAGVLLGTGVGLVLTQRRLLTSNLERNIEQRADDVRAVVLGGEVPRVLGARGEDEIVAQIVAVDGDVAAASPVIDDEPAIAPSPTGSEAWRNVHIRSVEDAEFRVLSRRVDGPAGAVVVHVAGAIDDIAESTRILAVSVAVAFPALTALLALLIWWLVGRTLRPVEAIRAEVAGMGGADLDRRVPEPAGDDEIARLARTMNAMLERVDDAARRQQRFVADASHELRAPLTRIRSEVEVDLAHPGTADVAETHRSILEEATGLQRLVDDLLHLARSDASVPLRGAPVDLDDVVLEDARRLRAEGHVSVDTAGVSAARVQGDATQLARAVRNLTDNAVRHARSAVAITLAEDDGAVVLSVADDGPGIPAYQRERVFERFARLDDARTASDGGTGLGLAIVRDIVERHHGTVRVDPDHAPGTRMVVTLPTSVTRQ
jgi:signal transduction histidine kinase